MQFPPPREARAAACGDNECLHCGTQGGVRMTAAQFEMIDASEAEELLRARFEALAEWGCPLGDALIIATHVEVDIVQAVDLVRRGCPSDLVLPILA
jgi:hypothetical protein